MRHMGMIGKYVTGVIGSTGVAIVLLALVPPGNSAVQLLSTLVIGGMIVLNMYIAFGE